MRNQLPPTSYLAGTVLGALVLISLLAGKALAQYAPDYVPADMLEPPPQAGRIEHHRLGHGHAFESGFAGNHRRASQGGWLRIGPGRKR